MGSRRQAEGVRGSLRKRNDTTRPCPAWSQLSVRPHWPAEPPPWARAWRVSRGWAGCLCPLGRLSPALQILHESVRWPPSARLLLRTPSGCTAMRSVAAGTASASITTTLPLRAACAPHMRRPDTPARLDSCAADSRANPGPGPIGSRPRPPGAAGPGLLLHRSPRASASSVPPGPRPLKALPAHRRPGDAVAPVCGRPRFRHPPRAIAEAGVSSRCSG